MHRTSALAVFLLAHGAWSSADDHDHDDHADEKDKFEWAGMFHMKEVPGTYLWTAQKLKGKTAYADKHMKIAIIPMADPEEGKEEAAFHKEEEEGNHALEQTCTEVDPGGTMTPKRDACYELHFDADMWQSTFKLKLAKGDADHLAIFTEHKVSEFERTAHYLKDDHGDDINPEHTLPEVPAPALPWGEVIGSAIIVNLITLIGVIFIAPCLRSKRKSMQQAFEAMTSAFASGALLAAAFFLLLFESVHYVEPLAANGGEAQANWRWGTMGLAGFLLSGVLDSVVLAIKGPASKPQTTSVTDSSKGISTDDVELFELNSVVRVRAGVLIGDLIHNLVDGIFLGAAFRYCGATRGWGIMASTVIHEIAQELADFCVLTGKRGRLSDPIALVLNFVSGLGVVLGAIIVMAADVSGVAVGLLLSLSAGVYIHVGATETMGSVYLHATTLKMRLACMGLFIIGAVIIGLVLISHEHCALSAAAAAAAGGGHAGHGH